MRDFFWNACRTYTALEKRTVQTARCVSVLKFPTISNAPSSPCHGLADDCLRRRTGDKIGATPYILGMIEKRRQVPRMVTITSADLRKQFGRCRELALKEPVSVTHHGRESLVVLSADEFKRLKALDTRQAFYAWELPEDLAKALEEAEPPAFTARFDHELDA